MCAARSLTYTFTHSARFVFTALTFSAAAFTLTCRTGVLTSVIRPSISTPDIPMRTGSPTRAVGPARRTGRSLGVFS
jgi:hypothetical protein